MSDKNRPNRHLIANDLAERLLPDLNRNELLLWSPDLFAFTSYILSMTGAYQLVISPPKNEPWFPTNKGIQKWLGIAKKTDGTLSLVTFKKNVELWMKGLIEEWQIDSMVSEWETNTSGIQTVKKFKPSLKTKVNAIAKDAESFLMANIEVDIANKSKPIALGDLFAEFTTIASEDDILREILKTTTKSARKLIKREFGEDDDVSKRYASYMGVKVVPETETKTLFEIIFGDKSGWIFLVESLGKTWQEKVRDIEQDEFSLINDENHHKSDKERVELLFSILLKRTPGLLLGCWAFFDNTTNDPNFYESDKDKEKLRISDLLCNKDDQPEKDKLWAVAQSLFTMHAVSDIACEKWGLYSPELRNNEPLNSEERAQFQAEQLLFGKGSLSTINTERARVMPKRHNPEIGITLRSLSSNLAFHRSPIDVVWRKSYKNNLSDRLKGKVKDTKISILLLPFPLSIKTKHFKPDPVNLVDLPDGYGFFEYNPPSNPPTEEIIKIIKNANEELVNQSVDIIVLPESAISEPQVEGLEEALVKNLLDKVPSIYIAGVRETKSRGNNFARNVVYCKCYNVDDNFGNETKNKGIEMYKQFKHHRWKLDASQIKQYGLSQVLNHNTLWWESIKVPRRRVSFLNIGDNMTMCHLICEDLARQDPIADLIRQVGPSLVVTILMDGPQKTDRWSSRYASVLSEDPGCSVITLTSFGMVRRWSSPYKEMSRVIGLWSESRSVIREIELEQGAKGVLLTLELKDEKEKTADGRQEVTGTSVLRLIDVIQIYSND